MVCFFGVASFDLRDLAAIDAEDVVEPGMARPIG